MKRLMVLGAGLLQIPVIKKAHEMGVFVLAADDNMDAPGLKLCDKPIVGVGIFNKERMLEVAREERINGVIHPCSEVAMNTMGFINDQMHLAGVGLDTAIRSTNKGQMRKAFEKGGAPSPKSFEVKSIYEACNFAEQLTGNIIVKPSCNSGSRGVTELSEGYSLTELENAFKRALMESRDKSVVVEQFVIGPEFSVEIIVSDSEIHVLTVTDKKTTEIPYFVELGHNQPSIFSKEDTDRIKDAAVRGVMALGLNNCAAHAEIKLAKDGPYLMEIGARLGGDFISTELVHLSTGIDMVVAAINVALGLEPNLNPKTKPQGAAIRYFAPKPGKLIAIDNLNYIKKDYVYQFEIYPKIGDEIRQIKSSLDRSGHVIITGRTAKEAIERADNIINNVKLITE